jgi:probable rRNA maturation factor
MIYLDIDPPYDQKLANTDPLILAAQTTLNHLEADPRASLSLRITGDEIIQALNKEFREVDAPTDVLSFSAGYEDPESGEYYLGDILISYPRAEDQAEQETHSTWVEIQLLIVHGVLHLLGFDHLTPEDKALMWQHQGDILDQLGLAVEVD